MVTIKKHCKCIFMLIITVTLFMNLHASLGYIIPKKHYKPEHYEPSIEMICQKTYELDPILLSAAAQLESVKEDLDIARSTNYPKLMLDGNVLKNYQNPHLRKQINTPLNYGAKPLLPNQSVSLKINAEHSLYDGGVNKANIEYASSIIAKEQAKLQQLEGAAFLKVLCTYNNLCYWMQIELFLKGILLFEKTAIAFKNKEGIAYLDSLKKALDFTIWQKEIFASRYSDFSDLPIPTNPKYLGKTKLYLDHAKANGHDDFIPPKGVEYYARDQAANYTLPMAELLEQKANYKLAKSSLAPNVTLSASFGPIASQYHLKNTRNYNGLEGSVGVNVTVPLFDPSAKANIRKAQKALMAARYKALYPFSRHQAPYNPHINSDQLINEHCSNYYKNMDTIEAIFNIEYFIKNSSAHYNKTPTINNLSLLQLQIFISNQINDITDNLRSSKIQLYFQEMAGFLAAIQLNLKVDLSRQYQIYKEKVALDGNVHEYIKKISAD